MNWIDKIIPKEEQEAHEAEIKAFQEGAPAPGPQGQVPADAGAPQGGANPEEMLMAFIQAEQTQPQGEESLKIAYAFTSMVAQDMMAQQQASQATPAMRKGAVTPKPVFGKAGKLKK